jgi:hypothetical protein
MPQHYVDKKFAGNRDQAFERWKNMTTSERESIRKEASVAEKDEKFQITGRNNRYVFSRAPNTWQAENGGIGSKTSQAAWAKLSLLEQHNAISQSSLTSTADTAPQSTQDTTGAANDSENCIGNLRKRTSALAKPETEVSIEDLQGTQPAQKPGRGRWKAGKRMDQDVAPPSSSDGAQTRYRKRAPTFFKSAADMQSLCNMRPVSNGEAGSQTTGNSDFKVTVVAMAIVTNETARVKGRRKKDTGRGENRHDKKRRAERDGMQTEVLLFHDPQAHFDLADVSNVLNQVQAAQDNGPDSSKTGREFFVRRLCSRGEIVNHFHSEAAPTAFEKCKGLAQVADHMGSWEDSQMMSSQGSQ